MWRFCFNGRLMSPTLNLFIIYAFSSFFILISSHLKLCLATATNNFKGVKITYMWSTLDQTFQIVVFKQSCFFKFEIIINGLASSYLLIWIPICYGSLKAGTVFIRRNLTYKDGPRNEKVRTCFKRIYTVQAARGLKYLYLIILWTSFFHNVR